MTICAFPGAVKGACKEENTQKLAKSILRRFASLIE
jgi:hypothetical protein